MWRSASPTGSNCIEASVEGGMVLLRETDDPTGGVVTTTAENLRIFARAVAEGEFNDMLKLAEEGALTG